MFGVGRDLCGSSSPTPLPKQGHLEQAAQHLVQIGLEYLQRRRISLEYLQRSTTSAKQLVHSSHLGALILATQTASLWPPCTSCRIRAETENSVPELDVPRIPTLLERFVISKY